MRHTGPDLACRESAWNCVATQTQVIPIAAKSEDLLVRNGAAEPNLGSKVSLSFEKFIMPHRLDYSWSHWLHLKFSDYWMNGLYINEIPMCMGGSWWHKKLQAIYRFSIIPSAVWMGYSTLFNKIPVSLIELLLELLVSSKIDVRNGPGTDGCLASIDGLESNLDHYVFYDDSKHKVRASLSKRCIGAPQIAS